MQDTTQYFSAFGVRAELFVHGRPLAGTVALLGRREHDSSPSITSVPVGCRLRNEWANKRLAVTGEKNSFASLSRRSCVSNAEEGW
jgi:hypothetical protein